MPRKSRGWFVPTTVVSCLLCAALPAYGMAPGILPGSHVQDPGRDDPASEVVVRRIAVTAFGVSGGAPDVLGEIVADLLVDAIDAEDVELVERRRVSRVIEEQAFSASDLTQPGEAVRVGRIANIRWILIGDLYRVEGVYVASARLVDAVTGTIHEDARASVQFRTVDELPERITELASLIGLRSAGPDAAQATPETMSTPDVLRLLRVVSPSNPHKLVLGLDPAGDRLRTGTPISARLTVARDGYLTLFAVDARNRISLLVPNARTPEFRIEAGETVDLPSDLGFRLIVREPLGPTRFKAIVTDQPLRLLQQTDSEPGTSPPVLDPVDLERRLTEGRWSSAETEFLVVDESGRLPATSEETPRFTEPRAPEALESDEDELEAVLPGNARGTLESGLLQWRGGLRTPALRQRLGWWQGATVPGIAWAMPKEAQLDSVLVGVVDGDFDPDDPCLRASFRHLDESTREELRRRMKRNGRVTMRHGNRVASLIGGDGEDALPSGAPGIMITPIPVTSVASGHPRRVDRGGSLELLAALQSALDAGCRVVNLSLCLRLSDDDRTHFIEHPVWSALEEAGVVLVCAAGNDGGNRDLDPVYPAALERSNILTVTATGPRGELLVWEGGGAAFGPREVDIAAPGGPLATSDGGGVPVLATGTSYACALVTAATAMVIAAHPDWSPERVVEALVSGADAVPGLEGLVRGGRLRWPD